MRNIRAIGEMRTTFKEVTQRCDESILRAYNILNEVKYLLREGVPAKVILELIEDMEDCSYLETTAMAAPPSEDQ